MTRSRTPAKNKARQAFPIVGVGASAGGLEAFTQLLNHLPADTGMSFVLVQHLDPAHESELAHILARATAMPTRTIGDNLRAEPDHVYVIPPNANLSIVDGVLKLQPRPEGRTPHRSIDFFFESLAHDQHERAIGVVLSGTATDGTLGLEAIKSEGGITFAQDESAKQGSMPRSAIASGCADFVLAPKDIARELVRIGAHPFINGLEHDAASAFAQRDGSDPPSAHEDSRGPPTRHTDDKDAHDAALAKILSILRNHCGVDFSLYKSSTIQRRLARRLVLGKHHTLDAYAGFLQENASERDTLFCDLLIGVTGFFRNAEAFESLQRVVFPRVLEQWDGDNPVRIWITGCSTGQEAYSIAMAFAEFLDTVGRAPRLQIFATDLSDTSLHAGRAGLYSKASVQDVSPERLRRFFTEEQGGYRVIKALREQIVFARQNLIHDPPFSRMDLISCRNLLIYLEPELQKKLIPSMHYALRPGGYLFLGASESVGQFTDLFEVVDKKHRIFRKKAAPQQLFHLPLGSHPGAYPPRDRVPARRAAEEGTGDQTAQREADRYAINHFAPPGVLINAELQVLQFRGMTGPYLEPPTGRATFDLLKMARRGLMLPLRTAITKAQTQNVGIRKEHVTFEGAGGPQHVNIQVVPLRNLKEPCFLVLFEPAGSSAEPSRAAAYRKPSKSTGSREEPHRIAELERELAELREDQQSAQEQSEVAAEELQASHEEVQSANEELQSINEELETSKEELESTNEELTTINEEMANRNAELHRLNADLVNLEASMQTAIVLLNRDLTIRRFTVPAEKIFDLAASDIGRSFAAVRHRLMSSTMLPNNLPETGTERRSNAEPIFFPLEAVIGQVIESARVREGEVQDRDGRWYSLRLRPYLTDDNKIDGAVMMLSDIDGLKRSEQTAKDALAYQQAILRTTHSPLLVLDGDLVIRTTNEAFGRTFRIQQAEGHSLLELSHGAWRIPKLLEILEEILPKGGALSDFELTQDFPGIGTRTLMLNATRLHEGGKNQALILLSMDDITELKHAEILLRDADHRKDEFLATLAHELRNPLAPIATATEILRLKPNDTGSVQAASHVMSRQIKHMVRLVDDLLDASRITRGRIELRRGRVEVASVVQQAIETTRSKDKDREFTVSLPSAPVYVDADPVRLAQIVGNLLHNARKFTHWGGHILLSVEREGDEVCIRIRDDGVGMTPDQIPRIFEMYTQLDTSFERRAPGLGIGLALVKRLVEMHSGTVEAHSAGKDHGSEFIVRLPILTELPTLDLAPPTGNVPDPTVEGLRILIADDNHDAAVTLGTLLQLTGNTTHIVGNGQDAVEATETFRPDVALLDIGMPELNGYDAARRIRAQPWCKDLILIALTGWGQEEDRQRSKEAGFDSHLAKPTDLASIARLIGEAQAGRLHKTRV